MPTPEALLDLIETHLGQTGKAAASFGMEAVGDPNFVRNLRAGREPRRRTVERVMAAITAVATPPTDLPAVTRQIDAAQPEPVSA